MTSKRKPKVVELTDIVNSSSFVGKFVEIKGVVVKEYTRGEIEPNKMFVSYEGAIEKEGLTLRIKGREPEIGFDVICLLSQKYGNTLFVRGKVCQGKDGLNYLNLSEVY